MTTTTASTKKYQLNLGSSPGQIWNAGDRKSAPERITYPDGYINGAQVRVIEGKEKINAIPDDLDCSVYPRPPAVRHANKSINQ